MSANPRYPDIFAGVLVGGRGSRLGGCDKARLPVADASETFLRRICNELHGVVREVVLSGRQDQAYPEVNARLVPDRIINAGPLGGLEALMAAAPVAWCLLVACDMPNFSASILHRLEPWRRDNQVQLVVPNSPAGLQPTCALYHRGLLPGVQSALQQGRRSLHALIDASDHVTVEFANEDSGLFTNVNTPDALG